jgi:hypothetical protein
VTDCIYCGAPADSKEHWLPRGFGTIKGLTLLKDRLCNDCNHALGHELDEAILRTGPTGFVRWALKIEGRHGKTVNPFHYRVMGKESATTLTMPSHNADYTILAESYTDSYGHGHARPLRQLVFKKDDGEMVPVPFPPAYDANQLSALLKERDVEAATLEVVYLGPNEGPDEFEDMRRVLTDAIGKFSAMVYYGEGSSGGKKEMLLKAGISRPYLRGLAKIAFHYYLAVCRTHTGAELLFQPLRRFIRYDEGEWRSFLDLTIPQFIGQLADGQVPECWSHFFGCNKVNGELVVALQFFIGPDHLMPPSAVRLGVSSRPAEQHCHWVSYYGDKIEGYNGEIREVLRQP